MYECSEIVKIKEHERRTLLKVKFRESVDYGVELEYKVGCTLCKAVKHIKELSLYAKSNGKSLMCFKQGNDKIINNKYHFFVVYKTYWRKVKRDFLAYRLFQHFRQETQLPWCR